MAYKKVLLLNSDGTATFSGIKPSSNTSVTFDNSSNNVEQYFKANSVDSIAKIRVSESNGGGIIGVFSKNTSGTQIERLRIDTDGKIGINVDSPTHNLNVYSGSGSSNMTVGKYASGKTVALLGTSADTSGYFQIQSYASQGSTFGNIALNSQGGAVGISTTSPAQGQSTPISDVKLDVLGNQMLSNLSATNTDQSKLFFFRSDGAVGSQGVVPSGLQMGAIEWDALTSGDNNNSIASARIETVASNTWSSASVRNADMVFSTIGANTLTERVRIDSSGHVSIGTDSTTSALVVQTTNAIGIDSAPTGSVSIGSPSGTLQGAVAGRQTANTTALHLMASATDANTSGDIVFNTRENNNSTFATTSNAGFKFQHFSSDLVTILRNGNVGIGRSTNIDKKLHILSSTSGDGMTLEQSSIGSNTIRFEANSSALRGLFGSEDSDGGAILSGSSGYSMVLRSEADIFLATNGNNEALKIDTSQNATFSGKVTITKNESDEYDNISYANSLLKLTNTNTTASQTHSLITFRLEKNGGDGYLGFKSGSSTNQEHFVVGNQIDGELLEIASGGNATFAGDVSVSATNKLRLDGASGHSYIYEHSNDDVRVYVGGTAVWDFLTTGAGVTATGKLHLDGGGDTYIQESSANVLKVFTGGTQALEINASQNATFGGDVSIKTDGGNDDPATLSLWSADTSIVINDTIGTILAQASDSGGSPPYTGAKIEFNADEGWDTSVATYYPTRIDFFTQSQAGADALASPRMSINSLGNATFANDVTVNGSIKQFRNDSSTVGTNDVVIENDGSGDASLKFSLTGATNWFAYVDNSDSDKFKIRRSTTDHFSINDSGKISVGTSAVYGQATIGGSGEVLSLRSSSGASELHFYEGGTTRGVISSLNGSDGIALKSGTTQRMVIDANSRISLSNNDSGTGNTIFGYKAGNAISTGHNNVVMGNNALLNSQDIGFAVAIGNSAMASGTMTSGADGTVAIGKSALTNLSSGANNVGIGANVLDQLTTGGYNTAIGVNALHALDGSESENVAIGYNAGSNGDGATNNILIGSNALLSTGAGTNQIVIGKDTTGVANNSVTLGNADVTAIYAGQDKGATLYSAGQGFGNVAMTWPTSDGSANQVLKTDGSGNLDWTNQVGGVGGGASKFTLVHHINSAMDNYDYAFIRYSYPIYYVQSTSSTQYATVISDALNTSATSNGRAYVQSALGRQDVGMIAPFDGKVTKVWYRGIVEHRSQHNFKFMLTSFKGFGSQPDVGYNENYRWFNQVSLLDYTNAVANTGEGASGFNFGINAVQSLHDYAVSNITGNESYLTARNDMNNVYYNTGQTTNQGSSITSYIMHPNNATWVNPQCNDGNPTILSKTSGDFTVNAGDNVGVLIAIDPATSSNTSSDSYFEGTWGIEITAT